MAKTVTLTNRDVNNAANALVKINETPWNTMRVRMKLADLITTIRKESFDIAGKEQDLQGAYKLIPAVEKGEDGYKEYKEREAEFTIAWNKKLAEKTELKVSMIPAKILEEFDQEKGPAPDPMSLSAIMPFVTMNGEAK